jgi:hypothetical protein
MAIDVPRPDRRGLRPARPRPIPPKLVAWAAALLVSLAMWAALGLAAYVLVAT